MYYTIETIPQENKLHGTILVEIEFTLNYTQTDEKWFTVFQIRIRQNNIENCIIGRENEFMNDLKDLQNFEHWLKRRNKPIDVTKAQNRLNKKHHPELKKLMDNICKKYNLFYMVD